MVVPMLSPCAQYQLVDDVYQWRTLELPRHDSKPASLLRGIAEVCMCGCKEISSAYSAVRAGRHTPSCNRATVLGIKSLDKGQNISGLKFVQLLQDTGAVMVRRYKMRRGATNSLDQISIAFGTQVGQEDPRTLKLKNTLRDLKENGSNLTNAVSLLQTGLQVVNSTVGPKHPYTLQLESDMLQMKLQAITETMGPTHQETFEAKRMLAKVWERMKNYQLAEMMLRELSDAMYEKIGPRHPETLQVIENLVKILYLQGGRLWDVEGLQRQLWESRNHSLGPSDQATLKAQNSLAKVLFKLGRIPDAEVLQREVWNARKHTLGPNHYETLNVKSDLAKSLLCMNRFKDAEVLQHEVLNVRNQSLGIEHPDTLKSKSDLASIAQAQGNLDSALTLQLEVLKGREKTLGNWHRDTLSTKGRLAFLYQELRDLERAEALQQEVLEARVQMGLPPEDVDVLASKEALARTLAYRGDLDGAENLLRSVVNAKLSVLGRRHPDTLRCMHSLAKILQDQRDLGSANKLQQEVFRSRMLLLGPEDPETLQTMSDLATTLFYLRSLEEAEALQKTVLEIRNRTLGPDHPDTLQAKNDLSLTLQDSGDREAAGLLMNEFSESGSQNSDVLTSEKKTPRILGERNVVGVLEGRGNQIIDSKIVEDTAPEKNKKFSFALRDLLTWRKSGKRKRDRKTDVDTELHDNMIRSQKSRTGSGLLVKLPLIARDEMLLSIRKPLIGSTCWAIVVYVLYKCFNFSLNIKSSLLPLGGPLGLLISFRTREAGRHKDNARKECAQIESTAISFAQRLSTHRNDCSEAKLKRVESLLRAFTSLLAEHLRAPDRQLKEDYSPLLTSQDLEQMKHCTNPPPLWITSRLKDEINSMKELKEGDRGKLLDSVFALTQCFSRCESLAASPMPKAYSRHLGNYLYSYIGLFAFAFVSELGCWIIPFMFFVSWAYVGIQESARKIEEPFRSEINLPMYSRKISAVVHEIMTEPDYIHTAD